MTVALRLWEWVCWCECSRPPLPGPSPENIGVGGCLSSVRLLPAPVPSVGFSTSGLVGSSSGTWLARSRLPSAKAGRTVQGSRGGPSLWTSGRTCRMALCRPRRERSSVPELYFKEPPYPSHSLWAPILQASTAHSYPSCQFQQLGSKK